MCKHLLKVEPLPSCSVQVQLSTGQALVLHVPPCAASAHGQSVNQTASHRLPEHAQQIQHLSTIV